MHKLPELAYGYDALEPAISRQIMKLHHTSHHQGYIDALNKGLEQFSEYKGLSVDDLCKKVNVLPAELADVVRKQGGGHYNHSLFWQCMTPGGAEMPESLQQAIIDKYGSVDAFLNKFAEKAKGVFGSGWVWLMPDLSITATQNQENPLMTGDNAPILGLDVWEHAYYLDYFKDRGEYIAKWFGVVDWNFVESQRAELTDIS